MISLFEKYLERPKHIEVQILADKYGSMVHLLKETAPSREGTKKLWSFTPAFAIDKDLRRGFAPMPLSSLRP